MLCFDMGGTTAKACLIDDGEPLRASTSRSRAWIRFRKGSGLPLKLPVIEMIEIGAGGGSIAQVDRPRPDPGGAGERRRRSRPGLLRPRRHAADGDGCRSRARLVGDVRIERSVDMRILGQVHEINVGADGGAIDAAWLADLAQRFERVYRQHFQHLPPNEDLEVINWRLRTSGAQPDIHWETTEVSGGESLKGRRPACFSVAAGFVETPVYDRYALPPGFEVDGPAIVEEREATTIVPPTDHLRVDEHGNLRITLGGAHGPRP
jgi:N-methylhydantoinase A/oxoprolinase/acetone carboxylase beta subunit